MAQVCSITCCWLSCPLFDFHCKEASSPQPSPTKDIGKEEEVEDVRRLLEDEAWPCCSFHSASWVAPYSNSPESGKCKRMCCRIARHARHAGHASAVIQLVGSAGLHSVASFWGVTRARTHSSGQRKLTTVGWCSGAMWVFLFVHVSRVKRVASSATRSKWLQERACGIHALRLSAQRQST